MFFNCTLTYLPLDIIMFTHCIPPCPLTSVECCYCSVIVNCSVRLILMSDIGYWHIGRNLNYQGWKGNRTLIADKPNLWGLVYDVTVAATWHQSFLCVQRSHKMPPPHRAHSYIQIQYRERGRWGVVGERGGIADELGKYLTPDYRVLKAEPVPSMDGQSPDSWWVEALHPTVCRTNNRPSTLLLMTLDFQEPDAANTPVCTGV